MARNGPSGDVRSCRNRGKPDLAAGLADVAFDPERTSDPSPKAGRRAWIRSAEMADLRGII